MKSLIKLALETDEMLRQTGIKLPERIEEAEKVLALARCRNCRHVDNWCFYSQSASDEFGEEWREKFGCNHWQAKT